MTAILDRKIARGKMKLAILRANLKLESVFVAIEVGCESYVYNINLIW